VKKNENKNEQEPIKELNLEDIKDPLADIIENNSIINEPSAEDINKINQSNNIYKSESDNDNFNLFKKDSKTESLNNKEEKQNNINNIDDDDDFYTGSVINQYYNEANYVENKKENKNNLENSENAENNIFNNSDKVEEQINQNNIINDSN
jgi:hypothetical protein